MGYNVYIQGKTHNIKDESRDWTTDQKKAISSTIDKINVSAAAGSGKTAVLTERILRRICEGKLDVDRMIVTTFTKSAARDLKSKIESAIRKAVMSPEGDNRLKTQLAKVNSAKISTIDTFLFELVSDNYITLDLPSNMGIMEEEDNLVLFKDKISQLKKEYLQDGDCFPGFSAEETKKKITDLIMVLGELKNNEGFDNAIRDIYDKCGSNISFDKKILAGLYDVREAEYAKGNVKWYENIEFENSPWFEYLKKYFAVLYKSVPEYIKKYELLTIETGTVWPDLKSAFENYKEYFLSLSKASSFDEMRTISKAKISLPSKTKKTPDNSLYDLKVEFSKVFLGESGDFYKTLLKKLDDKAVLDSDVKKNCEYIDTLTHIIKRLDEIMILEKKKRKQFCFNDITRFAYKLLSNEKGEPSEFCKEFSAQFDEIYLDEFQDTNEIQYSIFDMIRKSGSVKVFLVGDIKQCIYAFRNSEPDLFNRSISDSDGINSTSIKLSANFRSSENVVNAVNTVFSPLSLTCETFPYEKSDELVHGRKERFVLLNTDSDECVLDENELENACVYYTDSKPDEKEITDILEKYGIKKIKHPKFIENKDGKLLSDYIYRKNQLKGNSAFTDYILYSGDEETKEIFKPDTEIILCDSSSECSEDDKSSTDEEQAGVSDETESNDKVLDGSTLLAAKIKEMHKLGYAYRDIAVLLRDRKKLNEITSKLSKYGIPNLKDVMKEFFDKPEIQFIINILYVIENSLFDVYVIGSANGPMYNLTLSDMIRVKRKVSSVESLYEAFCKYTELDDADEIIKAKIQKYISDIDEFKNIYAFKGCSKLIDRIYKKTGILPVMMMNNKENYEEIKNNLDLFRKFVYRFEGGTRKTIVDLLYRIKIIHDEAQNQMKIGDVTGNFDAVSVMTIHGSKGLEFPCVIIMSDDLTKRNKNRYSIPKNMPVSMHVLGEAENKNMPPIRTKSFIYDICSECQEGIEMDEEVRLLYVAMTRAKDKLVIIDNFKKSDYSEYLKGTYAGVLNYNTRSKGKDYLKWILASNNGRTDVFKISVYSSKVIPKAGISTPVKFDYSVLEKSDKGSSDEELEKIEKLRITDEYKNAKELFESRFEYVYPHLDDINVAEKIYVSMIYPGILDYDVDKPQNIVNKEQYFAENQPKFIRKVPEMRRAGDVGTIIHSFMYFLDFDYVDNHGIDAEIQRIEDGEYMQNIDVELLKNEVFKKKIENFCKSAIAHKMREADTLWREVRFVTNFPAKYFTNIESRKQRFIDREVIVQGQMDVLFKDKNGKWTLLDYKTDFSGRGYQNIDKKQATEELIKRHALQLSLYKEAAEKLYGIKISNTMLYSFAIDDTIELTDDLLSVEKNIKR